jgi:hypothetical protein
MYLFSLRLCILLAKSDMCLAQILHGRHLVETLVLQLLVYPSGVPYSQLKLIVKHCVKQTEIAHQAKVGYADMEVEGVMEALRPYLVPRNGDCDDLVCFEHDLLRAAAYTRSVQAHIQRRVHERQAELYLVISSWKICV